MAPECSTNWLVVSNVALTIVIAAIAAYVAWRQWQTARQKLRFDLFDRRFALYEALQHMVTTALDENGQGLAALGGYMGVLAPARFLMETDAIDAYVSGVHNRLSRLYELRRDKHAANAATPEIDQELIQIEEWLRAQRDVIVALFKPHLRISA